MYKETKRKVVSKEEQSIIDAIEDAILELECIRNNFNNVKDPNLIEMAIYNEEAIKAKYCYLINEAKRLGIRYSRNVG